MTIKSDGSGETIILCEKFLFPLSLPQEEQFFSDGPKKEWYPKNI